MNSNDSYRHSEMSNVGSVYCEGCWMFFYQEKVSYDAGEKNLWNIYEYNKVKQDSLRRVYTEAVKALHRSAGKTLCQDCGSFEVHLVDADLHEYLKTHHANLIAKGTDNN